MKNKEFHKLLKKNKSKSNSGFTLTELLVGLIMSIFVIGALGFGLVTVLQATQRENSKAAARTENSRALDFISDELRRASAIETSETNARTGSNSGQFDVTDKTVVLALNIPEVNTSATFGSDADAGTTERIIYYLQAASNNWKEPQVLYRWGPPLDANGNYTNGQWGSQALIDGIDDTIVSNPCPTGTVTPVAPANPTGFYACITGTNTAQLFLTGQTKAASGLLNESQTNDTQVVARARAALANNTQNNSSINWNVEGLGGSFNCQPPSTAWDMQTDFTNDPTDPTKTTSWQQKPGLPRQAQPLEIDITKPLTITSTATGQDPANCLNDPIPVTHVIDFGDPTTFNGDHETDITANDSTVGSDEAVQFFKKGFNIPNYGGYDVDSDGVYEPSEGDQQSLGRFLYDNGLAIPVSGGDPNDITTTFRLPTTSELESYLTSSSLTASEKAQFKTLGDDQRIIGFEMGDRANTTRPGFDLQDNIFIVTSNVFQKKFPAGSF